MRSRRRGGDEQQEERRKAQAARAPAKQVVEARCQGSGAHCDRRRRRASDVSRRAAKRGARRTDAVAGARATATAAAAASLLPLSLPLSLLPLCSPSALLSLSPLVSRHQTSVRLFSQATDRQGTRSPCVRPLFPTNSPLRQVSRVSDGRRRGQAGQERPATGAREACGGCACDGCASLQQRRLLSLRFVAILRSSSPDPCVSRLHLTLTASPALASSSSPLTLTLTRSPLDSTYVLQYVS